MSVFELKCMLQHISERVRTLNQQRDCRPYYCSTLRNTHTYRQLGLNRGMSDNGVIQQ